MKKALFILLAIPGLALAAETSVFDSGSWILGNNTLTTNIHAPVNYQGQTYDHSINYTLPNGMQSSTDFCALSSANKLNCITSETAVYDAQTYSVTLTSNSGSFTYYDKNHVPGASPMTGTWHRVNNQANCRNGMYTNIDIPYYEKNATSFQNVTLSSPYGYSKGNNFYIVKNSYYNYYVLSPVPSSYYSEYVLYDANDQPIYDLNKLGSAVKLNDSFSNFDPNCNFIK